MRSFLLILAALNVVAAYHVLTAQDGEAAGGFAPVEATDLPTRIVPCSASAADWLAALVEPDRIAALPEQVAKWSTHGRDEELADVPRFARVEAEALLGQRPDLVLVSPPITNAATIRRIQEAGVPVVDVLLPESWDDILASGRAVAEATGTLERWETLEAELEARREALARNAPANPPRILPFGNYGTENYTSGAGTTLDLALRLAGCTNHATTLGIEGPGSVSVEEILARPFDWFLVGGESPDNPSTRALASNERLQTLPPVEDRRYVQLSSALYSSASFTILRAAETIQEAVGGQR